MLFHDLGFETIVQGTGGKMSRREQEPWKVASLDEVLALARAMEQEAIEGYRSLCLRMQRENRPDLASVFEKLIAEETSHLDSVARWQEAVGSRSTPARTLDEPLFDDEGAALVAPELLDAYKAFSMAVRNEERAFVFWTYVAAHAPSEEIKAAAERMAREELGHVATLRRERRKAFHSLRSAAVRSQGADIGALELELSEKLREKARQAPAEDAAELQALADSAQERSTAVATGEVQSGAVPAAPSGISDRLVPLCEFLLDSYLLLAEQATDGDRQQSLQEAAGAVLRTLYAVRKIP